MTSKNIKGFTIIEVLIALSIVALLMAAIATAFDASAKSFEVNEDIYKAMSTARQALTRITTELRTADMVFPDAEGGTFEQGLGYGLVQDLSDPNDLGTYTKLHTYHYNNSGDEDSYDDHLMDNTLYLTTNGIATDPNYVLCENVTAMTFTRTYIDPAATDKVVKNVKVSITVAAGDVSQTLTAAAAIRKNQ
jgi:prepilin-type N-terminal cleavage/methylation domain-containing protein